MKLSDLDKGHPFYSDEAIRTYKRRIKELEQEEKGRAKKKKPREDSGEQGLEDLVEVCKR